MLARLNAEAPTIWCSHQNIAGMKTIVRVSDWAISTLVLVQGVKAFGPFLVGFAPPNSCCMASLVRCETHQNVLLAPLDDYSNPQALQHYSCSRARLKPRCSVDVRPEYESTYRASAVTLNPLLDHIPVVCNSRKLGFYIL